MRSLSFSILSLLALLAGHAVFAQYPNGLAGSSQFNPPLPQGPPPPRIEVPKVPQFDAPPHYDYSPPPRNSFGDRITRCLDEAAAAGVPPGGRAAYSRACANRD